MKYGSLFSFFNSVLFISCERKNFVGKFLSRYSFPRSKNCNLDNLDRFNYFQIREKFNFFLVLMFISSISLKFQ